MGRANYQKVFDDRKRRIRGLWKRNGHFYARLVMVDEINGRQATKRVRLEKARTIAEARTALQNLQKDRREENLPILKQSPKLTIYWGARWQAGRVNPLRAAACQRTRSDSPRRRARSDAPCLYSATGFSPVFFAARCSRKKLFNSARHSSSRTPDVISQR